MQKERKDKNFIKKPIFKGGPKAMRKFITEHLQYPADALQKKIEGTVSLKYTIDHVGKVIDTHVIAGLGHGCDEEAARLVRLFTFEVPKTRGVKVQFHNNIHIHFRLPKKKQPVPQKMTTQYVYTTPAATPAPDTKPKEAGYHYTLTITPGLKKKSE